MKIPLNIEKSIWEILTKLPKDECKTLREFSEQLKIPKERVKNKLTTSEKIQKCKIKISAERERVGYINPKYVR